MNVVQEYLLQAAAVAAAYPEEGATFALDAARDAHGQNPVAVAAKRIWRRNNRHCESLLPLTIDGERTAYATARIIFDVRK